MGWIDLVGSLRSSVTAALVVLVSGAASPALSGVGIVTAPLGMVANVTKPAAPVVPLKPPEEIVLQARAVAFVSGEGKWDDAEEKLGEAFKSIYGELAKANIKPTGMPLVEYTDSDEESFSFRAMVPIPDGSDIDLGEDVEVGLAPSGKVLRFVHQGRLEDLEQVYNRIDDYLAAHHLEMKRVVEAYGNSADQAAVERSITEIFVFTE